MDGRRKRRGEKEGRVEGRKGSRGGLVFESPLLLL